MRICVLVAAAVVGVVAGSAVLQGTASAREDEPVKAAPNIPKVTTSLMFFGKAEEAMNAYMKAFKDSKVIGIERWKAGEPGEEGKVKHAVFSLDGQVLRCLDSLPVHPFKFTPATSLFVSCASEAEIDALFAELSREGEVSMPLQAYPFAKKFAWFDDRFGVSWQLHLPLDGETVIR